MTGIPKVSFPRKEAGQKTSGAGKERPTLALLARSCALLLFSPVQLPVPPQRLPARPFIPNPRSSPRVASFLSPSFCLQQRRNCTPLAFLFPFSILHREGAASPGPRRYRVAACRRSVTKGLPAPPVTSLCPLAPELPIFSRVVFHFLSFSVSCVSCVSCVLSASVTQIHESTPAFSSFLFLLSSLCTANDANAALEQHQDATRHSDRRFALFLVKTASSSPGVLLSSITCQIRADTHAGQAGSCRCALRVMPAMDGSMELATIKLRGNPRSYFFKYF